MPKDNILIHDALEVYLRDDSGKQYFYGITTKGEISQKVKQDIIKGGIGNTVCGVMQSEKEMSFKVSTALQNDTMYEVLTGSTFSTGTLTVRMTERAKLATGKLTITGTPKTAGTVLCIDSLGKQFTGTFATGQVTITGGTEGAYYTVVYDTDKSNMDILTLDSAVFPKNYYVELHTIAYSPDTNTVLADIFWQFDKALPKADFTESYEAGKANDGEVEFTAITPVGSTAYGRYAVAYRA